MLFADSPLPRYKGSDEFDNFQEYSGDYPGVNGDMVLCEAGHGDRGNQLADMLLQDRDQ